MSGAEDHSGNVVDDGLELPHSSVGGVLLTEADWTDGGIGIANLAYGEA